jgi:hypothetical protein
MAAIITFSSVYRTVNRNEKGEAEGGPTLPTNSDTCLFSAKIADSIAFSRQYTEM